jgi:hypothetical protein
VTVWKIPAGKPRRGFSTARIRAMFADFIADPASFSDEQRQRLTEGFVWLCDIVDRDAIVALAVTGTHEIEAFLSQGDTETRDE